jgi:glucan-binding YG repeat protein
MSEKKGQLEKLRYNFDTAKGVFVKMNDKMYRVTERDFRSHNGDRYIYTKLSDGTYEYIPYKGPIYYHNTNQKCKECIGDGLIQYAHNKPWVSIRRPGENYLIK